MNKKLIENRPSLVPVPKYTSGQKFDTLRKVNRG